MKTQSRWFLALLLLAVVPAVILTASATPIAQESSAITLPALPAPPALVAPAELVQAARTRLTGILLPPDNSKLGLW